MASECPQIPDWMEAMLHPGYKRLWIPVDKDLNLHALSWGPEDASTVIWMVHGNPSFCFLYRKVVAELLKQHADKVSNVRIVVPDMLGMGFSSGIPDTEHQLRNHSTWMSKAVDFVVSQGAKRFLLVGQDWGGPVMLHTFSSAEKRKLICGMVVLNTVVGPPKPNFKPTLVHRLSHSFFAPFLFGTLGATQNIMWLAQNDRNSIAGDVAAAYRFVINRDPLKHNSPLRLLQMVPDSLEHPTVEPLKECHDVFTSFNGPVAIVWGDNDPVLGSVRSYISKLKPDAPVTRTGAGHFLQEEVPVEIASGVVNVLSRI